ncbi:hypothetical protein [Cellulosimicrobium funkei]|uniref:hypothetical protein n=1 Tax=Cellulosimicrobium funkei TaxID=264251 RepID=UPI0037DC11A5
MSHPASRRRRTAAVVAVLPRLVRACRRSAATHTRSGPVDAWSASASATSLSVAESVDVHTESRHEFTWRRADVVGSGTVRAVGRVLLA